MVVVFLVIILLLLGLFVLILPYIILAGMFAIPIYVTYHFIKRYRKRQGPFRPTRLTASKRYNERLTRSRLKRFNLSEKEAELVFGPRWRIKLRKKLIESNHGFFFDIIAIQTKILFDLCYRKQIFHIIDRVTRMIDSVFNEDLEIVRIFEKNMTEQLGAEYYNYYYKNQWEYFKTHKKTSFDPNSENTLDKTEAYKTLELDITATIEQVQKKYRELALKWHPDRNPTNKTQAEQKFVKIRQAYETIMAEYIMQRSKMAEENLDLVCIT